MIYRTKHKILCVCLCTSGCFLLGSYRSQAAQTLPENLDKVLAEVTKRRCSQCHENGKVPRRVWTRVTEPQLNNFLLAPLAISAGGNEKCKTAVFADTSDPDYQAILATFAPITEMLKSTPRMDMPAGQPAPDLCRDCQ